MNNLMNPSITNHSVYLLDNLRNIKSESHICSKDLDSQIGRGSIELIKFRKGFKAIEIDVLLSNDVEIELFKDDSFLYFLYVIEGGVYHKFNNQSKVVHVEELSPAIVGSNGNSQSSIFLKNNKKVRLNILCINKNLFFEEYSLNDTENTLKTQSLLKGLNNLDENLHLCSKNLKLSEKFRTIKSMDRSDEFLTLYSLKSQYHLAIGDFLKQFYTELFVNKIETSLTLQELQQIRKLTEYIIDNPEEQHTIKKLCQQSGLSPTKLQNGFKSMHERTVSHFIRDKRLEKAKFLFENTDYNVSEVVYMVGITSRSYFCKIFKLKYNICPSNYRTKTAYKMASVANFA